MKESIVECTAECDYQKNGICTLDLCPKLKNAYIRYLYGDLK